jgi:hypothetical protein
MKLALVFPLFLVALSGCSKPSPEEQKKNEEKLAAALASAMTAPASSAPTLTGATAAAPATAGAIQATCSNPTDGKCKEFKGAMGLGAEDSCKALGGTFKNGATPCSQDNLLGTCELTDSTSGLNDVDYFYKSGGVDAAGMKSLCEGVMSGKWVPAAKAAAPAAKAAAPAAKAAAPKAKK